MDRGAHEAVLGGGGDETGDVPDVVLLRKSVLIIFIAEKALSTDAVATGRNDPS
jgi:hypothetical protein